MGWKESFGANIRKLREDAGLSLRAVSDAVGVTPETIRQYELGRVPDADKLVRIAVALNASEFVLDEFTLSVAQKSTPEVRERPEQLSLDFSAEYTASKATIRIRPGSVSVILRGVKVDKAV